MPSQSQSVELAVGVDDEVELAVLVDVDVVRFWDGVMHRHTRITGDPKKSTPGASQRPWAVMFTSTLPMYRMYGPDFWSTHGELSLAHHDKKVSRNRGSSIVYLLITSVSVSGQYLN